MAAWNSYKIASLSRIRRTLILARYYKQVDQFSRELNRQTNWFTSDTVMPFQPYDGHYGFVAQCLRISARTMLVQMEKQAGKHYVFGIAPVGAAWLFNGPFREWDEYKTIMHINDDTWSKPGRQRRKRQNTSGEWLTMDQAISLLTPKCKTTSHWTLKVWEL